MTFFLNSVLLISETDTVAARGYSDLELSKMEILYDIKISGDLRSFLSEGGRTEGKTGFLDLTFFWGFYSPKSPAMVRMHLLGQQDFRDDILRYGRPFITGNPFLISIEYETQYYFLRTRADEPLRGITPEDDYSQLSDNPEIVYHYDENEETVRNTGMTFREYLQNQAKRVPLKEDGFGEMIVI